MSPSSNLLALALFVVASTRFAEACDCMPFWGNLCDLVIPVDIVLRATVLERTEGADINDDITYSLQSVEVFKAENISEPEYAEGSTFDAAMPGNDGLCGINLDIGVDYLLDFNRWQGTINAVGLCGLSREWSSVDAEDEATLREGCDDYDPCEGSCDEFQECKKGFFSSIGYYCEGPCEVSSCADDEECVLMFSSSCDLSESCSPEVTCQQPSAIPSQSPGGFITLTLPPGASIASNTDGAGTPAPGELRDALTLPPGAVIDSTTGFTGTPASGELGDALTLPPGAVIDSTTDGTSAPSPNELTYLSETLFPVESIDSTSGAGTPVPGELGDALTLPPGAVIDSTTDCTSAPSSSRHGGTMTLSPSAVIDSTTGPTGTPASGELGDAMTLPPGSTVDSSSTLKTAFPTFSPTASPTSSPSGESGADGSNGADGVGRSKFVSIATCLATMAAVAAGFGSDLCGGVLFAT